MRFAYAVIGFIKNLKTKKVLRNIAVYYNKGREK